jgi:hypothetical protein
MSPAEAKTKGRPAKRRRAMASASTERHWFAVQTNRMLVT